MKLEDVIAAATSTFSLPEVCVELRKILDDSKTEFQDVAKVISTDPILSAKLLRLANSALFRFSQQIDTVHRAVSVLGGEAVFNLALANALGSSNQSIEANLLDTKAYWFDCLLRGVLSKEIAQANKVRGAERFFVMGIMSRLSEMVIAANFPEVYKRYLEQSVLSLPWHAERAEFGFTFASANGAICEVWGLPASLHLPMSKVFTLKKNVVDNDTKTLQLAIKTTLFDKKHSAFQEISALQPEMSLWRDNETTFIDMIDSSKSTASKMQSFF